jgi:hypothetical protein
MILLDGFNTTLTFPGTGSTLIEKTITPSGGDAGGPIDFTAMRNARYRTFAPKSLITMTPLMMKAKFDPAYYITAFANLGVNQACVLNFPTIQAGVSVTAHTLTFWGWLNTFKPEEFDEGKLPLADVEVQPSNINGSYAETAPAFA